MNHLPETNLPNISTPDANQVPRGSNAEKDAAYESARTEHRLEPALKEKYHRLLQIIRQATKAVVAFSGGVRPIFMSMALSCACIFIFSSSSSSVNPTRCSVPKTRIGGNRKLPVQPSAFTDTVLPPRGLQGFFFIVCSLFFQIVEQ